MRHPLSFFILMHSMCRWTIGWSSGPSVCVVSPVWAWPWLNWTRLCLWGPSWLDMPWHWLIFLSGPPSKVLFMISVGKQCVSFHKDSTRPAFFRSFSTVGHVEWPSQDKSFSHVNRWFFFLNSQVPFSAVGNKYTKKSIPLTKSNVSVSWDTHFADVLGPRQDLGFVGVTQQWHEIHHLPCFWLGFFLTVRWEEARCWQVCRIAGCWNGQGGG